MGYANGVGPRGDRGLDQKIEQFGLRIKWKWYYPIVAKDFEAKRSSRALAFFWSNLRLDRTGRFLALPVVALQVKSKT